MRRIFEIMKKHFWLYSFGLVFAALCWALRELLVARLLRDLFDASVLKNMTDLTGILTTGILYLVILSVCQPFFFYLLQRATIKIGAGFRLKLYNKVQSLTIKYFKSEHSGNLISRLTNDVNTFEQGYNLHIPTVLTFFFSGLGAIIFMFFLDYRLALVSLITGSLSLVISALYARPLRRVGRLIQERLGFLTENFSDIYAGIQVIKSFNLYSILLKKFGKSNQDVYQAAMTRVKRNSELVTLNGLARMIDILGYIIVGAYFAFNGWVSVGTIIAISQLKNPVMRLFMQMGNLIANIQAALAAGDRIFEVLEVAEEPEKYQHLQTPEKISQDKAIILKNVDFGYNPVEKLFQGLSLEIKRGSKVALVGLSGSGKSTLFKILLGFYPAEKGEILINGKSMGQHNLQELREMIAYVPQNAYLFTGTIMENICYGNPRAVDEEVIQAAKIANAHEFISSFDNGYQTLVGEKGTQLSGGQRQRIAIARAVLKDTTILLLDEATSSLDTEAERLVQEALDRLTQGRTTLVIAHRFATIRDADEIIVLSDGQVKEQGRHADLMSLTDGIYRHLYELTEAS